MTRAFRLINAVGDSIDLLADLDVFGLDPQGLGVEFEHNAYESNSNYLLEKSTVKQNEFKLSIAFGYISLDPYNAYMKLVKLLDSAPYMLEYETPAGKWVREVRLKELTKTEIVSGDIMMENFTLSCFTPWYRIVEHKYDPGDDIPGDGKIYRHYPYTNALKKLYAFARSADGTLLFTDTYPKPNILANTQFGDDLKQWSFTTQSENSGGTSVVGNRLIIQNNDNTKWAQVQQYNKDVEYNGGVLGNDVLNQLKGGSTLTISCDIINLGATAMSENAVKFVLRNNRLSGGGYEGFSIHVSNSLLDKDVKYHFSATVNIPEDIFDNMNYLRFLIITYVTGPIGFENLKMEVNDRETPYIVQPGEASPPEYTPYPQYIGTREVGSNRPANNNLTRKQDIKPYLASDGSILEFVSWKDTGTMRYIRPGIANGGIYINDKVTSKPNTNYILHLKFKPTVYGTRNMLIYTRGYVGDRLFIDGEEVIGGIGETGNSQYYFVAPEDEPDWKEHEILFYFHTEDTIATSYQGLIFQPNKQVLEPSEFIISEVKTMEGTEYDGYTQEELPEFYTWQPSGGPWSDPSMLDGYQLIAGLKDYNYDYINHPLATDTSMSAYTYDYIYEAFVNGANGSFRVDNNSIYINDKQMSPTEITINGPANNPYWQVIKNSKVIAEDGFRINIQAGYKLVVSSVPGEQSCKLIAPDGTTSNVYQQQRLEMSNFVKVPRGRCEMIFFNCKNIEFKVREEYVVV